jgi:hypothetical protein
VRGHFRLSCCFFPNCESTSNLIARVLVINSESKFLHDNDIGRNHSEYNGQINNYQHSQQQQSTANLSIRRFRFKNQQLNNGKYHGMRNKIEEIFPIKVYQILHHIQNTAASSVINNLNMQKVLRSQKL